MRFYVWKKKVHGLITGFLVINLLGLPFVILLALVLITYGTSELGWQGIAAITMFLVSLSFLNIVGIAQTPNECSSVVFEDSEIKCVFLKRIRRQISYDEIKDIVLFPGGTPQLGTIQYIGISRFPVPKEMRNITMYKLYTKTKDVIVVEHHESIMELLKDKRPDIVPWVQGENTPIIYELPKRPWLTYGKEQDSE